MASSRIDYTEYTGMMIIYVLLYTGIMFTIYTLVGEPVSMRETLAMALSIVVSSVIFAMMVISLYKAKIIKTNPAIIT